MKKFFRMLVLTICILLVSVPVFAENELLTSTDYGWGLYDPIIANSINLNEVKVQLDGDYLDFTDADGEKVEPQIINGRTMVPMRKIFETLGATVEWDGENRIVTGTKEDTEIKLQIGSNIATKTVSGETKNIELDVTPTIVDGRTLVPVRFIAESLDKTVGWDSDNRTVVIMDSNFIIEKLKKDASNLYEYITTDFEKLDTFELTVALDGKLKYTDSEDRSNNTNLTLAGNVDFKYDGKLVGIDGKLNVAGKGELLDQIKSLDMQKITFSAIVDIENGTTYITSSLLGEDYDGKWIKQELSKEIAAQYAEMLKNAKESDQNFVTSLNKILETAATSADSYEQINNVVDVICKIFKNSNFKVSGRSAKTYTFSIDLKDIVKILEIENFDKDIDFSIDTEVKVNNNIADNSKVDIKASYGLGDEKVDITLTSKTKINSYNKSVKITMPKDKDIVTM